MLVTTFFLAGCALTNRATQIAETEAAIAAAVCRVWRPVTYSSRDTETTRREAQANNAAQAVYCQGGS